MNASVSARIVNPSGRNPSTFLPDGPPTALSVALNAACESHEPLLRVFVRCYDLTPTAYLVPGGARIETPDELADRVVAALALRRIGGLQQVVQANHAAGYQELRQEPFRVLRVLSAGYRTEDHRDYDRHVLPVFAVTVLALDVCVHSA